MEDSPAGADLPPRSIGAGEIRELVTALSRPRFVGSDGARRAAAQLRDRFRTLDYEATELDFSFSALPGRFGLPVAGLLLVATGAVAGWLLSGSKPGTALAVLALGLGVTLLPLVFLDPMLRKLPRGRVRTANLLFTRGAPRWIVMAHRDSKSQGVPTLVRTVALAAVGVGWAALAVTALAAVAGAPAPASAGVAAGAALGVGGVVLVLSPAGNRSPGALDNGTGLAALLALAARTSPDVAFLVTDGEEMGLAGARAVADRLPPVEGIINLDGLDDRGPIRIAEGRLGRRGGAAAPLAAALQERARGLGLEARRRPLPPLVMVDHEPLAAAGLPALTLLKGDWRSLLRVHRAADVPEAVEGTGAADVAALVLAVLGGWEGGNAGTLRAPERSGHSPPS